MAIEDYLPKEQKQADERQKKERAREEARSSKVQRFLTYTFSQAAKLEQRAAHAIANKSDVNVILRDARPINSLTSFFGAIKDALVTDGSYQTTVQDIKENPKYQEYVEKLARYGYDVENVTIETRSVPRAGSYRVAKLALNHEKANQMALNI